MGLCVDFAFCPLQENQRLREQNEELNGQILSLSLHEAKNLISTQTKAQSLAAEIENASRDQVPPEQHHSYTQCSHSEVDKEHKP